MAPSEVRAAWLRNRGHPAQPRSPSVPSRVLGGLFSDFKGHTLSPTLQAILQMKGQGEGVPDAEQRCSEGQG